MSEENNTTEQPFISRLTVSKVANLGNYENRKVEISVNFNKSDKVGNVYSEIEQIIEDINCLNNLDTWELSRARKFLSMPASELSPVDINNLPLYRERIEKHDHLVKRRQAALERLNSFGGQYEYKDAKDNWEDDD